MIINAMAKRVSSVEEDTMERDENFKFEHTVNDNQPTSLEKYSNLKPNSMSFKKPIDEDKTMNDRDPSFKNDVTMKSG
jgi:hypothetical protein